MIQTGANDVYQVVTEEGKEILIPAIRQCILEVDVEEGRMKVHSSGRAGVACIFHVLTLFPEMIEQIVVDGDETLRTF